jgi:hypothetical protein
MGFGHATTQAERVVAAVHSMQVVAVAAGRPLLDQEVEIYIRFRIRCQTEVQ